MNTTDENKRYPIPGFHYEISKEGGAWNLTNGRAIKSGPDKRYSLNRQGRVHRFTFGKLLYAIEQNVDPSTITGLVIMAEGKPILVTRADYCRKVVIPFRHSSSRTDLVERYRDYIRIATIMIDFYEKGNMEQMASIFTIYEFKIKGYMYAGGFSTSQDVINEAWQSILARVLSSICEKKLVVADPYNYLRRCVRSYFSERKKERMALRKLPETRKGIKSYDEIMEML